MTLLGSIARLQTLGSQFYANLAQVFSANNLIRETWASMSQDLTQQVESVQSLPHSFWIQFKSEETKLRESIQACWTPQDPGKETDRTLQYFLSRSLDFEEPLILQVYVPLIRHLRVKWSGQVLDLYIMVKAHLSRLLQVIRSFSGDPASIHRVSSLFQTFEKDVQVPEESAVSRPKSVATITSAGRRKKVRQVRARVRKVSRRSRSLEKRPIPKRRAALVKVPRRAQR